MSRLILLMLISSAPAIFPWEGTSSLKNAKGGVLSWTVSTDTEKDLVTVQGRHPDWTVTHTSHADGTPISTVKVSKGITTRVTFDAKGATYERTGTVAHRVDRAGLWDADTLDVRLAGISWSKGKKVRFEVIDTDSEAGDLVPLVAEYVGQEDCGALRCHHVHLALSDWRRPFGPSWDYFYGVTAGAPYLGFESGGQKFRGY